MRSNQQEGVAELDELMRGYQRADPLATSSLIEAVTPLLYRYFCYRPASRDWAADLVQEVWLRIHKSRHTYRPGDAVLPWIYAIARHAEVDVYRKRRRIEMVEYQMDAVPEAASADSGMERIPSFEAMMAELPDSQREVV
ncbi:MAG: sigma factor, partial [Bryobacteraceae bacterium]